MSNKEKDNSTDIISYINTLAELYADRKSAKDEKEKKKAEASIKSYKEIYGGRSVTLQEVEEAFAYAVQSGIAVSVNSAKASESKISILLKLLKQNNVITNSAYESAVSQFRSINRDYYI